jgi:hypothetical protein
MRSSKVSPLLAVADRVLGCAGKPPKVAYSKNGRLVAVALGKALNVDERGRYSAWPGIRLLSAETGIGLTAVKRAVRELIGETGRPPLFARQLPPRPGATLTTRGRQHKTPRYTLIEDGDAYAVAVQLAATAAIETVDGTALADSHWQRFAGDGVKDAPVVDPDGPALADSHVDRFPLGVDG